MFTSDLTSEEATLMAPRRRRRSKSEGQLQLQIHRPQLHLCPTCRLQRLPVSKKEEVEVQTHLHRRR